MWGATSNTSIIHERYMDITVIIHVGYILDTLAIHVKYTTPEMSPQGLAPRDLYQALNPALNQGHNNPIHHQYTTNTSPIHP